MNDSEYIRHPPLRNNRDGIELQLSCLLQAYFTDALGDILKAKCSFKEIVARYVIGGFLWLIVKGTQVALAWIQVIGQFLKGYMPYPLIFSIPSGNGKSPVPLLAYGRRGHVLIADISIGICVADSQGCRSDMADGTAKLLKVSCPLKRLEALKDACRFCPHPLHCRILRGEGHHLRDNGAMAGYLDKKLLFSYSLLCLYPDSLLDDLEVAVALFCQVLVRVFWIQFFDEVIELVNPAIDCTPGNASVEAHDINSRRAGKGAADDIIFPRFQMNEIKERGDFGLQVGAPGKDRLPRG